MNRKSLLSFSIFLTLLAGTGFMFWLNEPRPPETLADLAPDLGLEFPAQSGFRLAKNQMRGAGNQTFRSIEAVRNSRILKLEIITGLDPKQARQTLNERLDMIETLFSNVPSPYPGLLTNTVEIPDTVKPGLLTVTVAGRQLPLYILAASSRKTYGAMAAEQVAFRAGVLFFYVEARRTFYRCDYFLPTSDFAESELITFFSGLTVKDGTISNLSPPETLGRNTSQSVAAAAPAAPGQLRRPGFNLILIAFEPLGAKHVGAYGYPKNTTPNLDDFARESFLFADAISPSSWTLPAFMSWFTSLYPDQHRMVNKFSKFSAREEVLASLPELTPDAVTLTQVLHDRGYRTAAFTGGASLNKDFGFGLGFEVYRDQPRFAGFDRTMPEALEWLGQHGREKFFLFVQGYDVHGQFPLDRTNLDRFLDPPYRGTAKATEEEYWALRDRNLETGGVTLSPEDLRLWQAVYDTKIYEADRRFGAFVEQLRKLGLLDNSIVVVSSGSGNEYLEHGRIDHGFSLYEELLRVPLLIRVPGAQGRRIPDLVRTLDLMPTTIDLLGLTVNPKVQKQMRGTSLAPIMAGQHLNLDAVSETDYLQRSFKRSIKTGDGWKFIISLDTEERELYNLNNDPGEQHNLVRAHPRLAYELEQKMFAILQGKP